MAAPDPYRKTQRFDPSPDWRAIAGFVLFVLPAPVLRAIDIASVWKLQLLGLAHACALYFLLTARPAIPPRAAAFLAGLLFVLAAAWRS